MTSPKSKACRHLMNSKLLSNIVRFVVLVLVQVLVLNHINFLGYVNPYLYVLFIVLLPFNISQWKILLWAFLIGLAVDLFEDSGGIQAAACLVVAYLRPLILRFSYGISYDHQTIKFYKTPFAQRFVYVSLLVFIHHFILFTLTFFNFSHIILILKNTLFSSIFTILLILIVTTLFQKGKR